MIVSPALSGVSPLAHWGVIRARGDDAAAFLHGQLTQDVVGLGLNQARLAGYCSAKGRMLASFVIWKALPDDVLLACHASVLASTLKRLSMFVLRAKCKLTDATADLPLLGIAGEPARLQASDLAPWQLRAVENGWLLRLPDAAGVARAVQVAGSAISTSPAQPTDAWRWLEVQSGVPVIESATQEQFVPQMLNFELVGGVNFKKGCYPGQEVVARAQYRGTVKRRMFLFDVDAAASPGQEIFHSDDPTQPAGMVANAAPRPMCTHVSASLLAEVKLASLERGTLHLGAPDGPRLVRQELPYPLLDDADQPA
jgi:tRNA-modifying protein YgfZ